MEYWKNIETADFDLCPSLFTVIIWTEMDDCYINL